MIELIIQNGLVVGAKCATVEEAVEYQRRTNVQGAPAHPVVGLPVRRPGRPRKNPPAQPIIKNGVHQSSIAILSAVVQGGPAGVPVTDLAQRTGHKTAKSLPPQMAVLRADLRAVGHDFDNVMRREERDVDGKRQGVYFAKSGAASALEALKR